MEPVYVLVGAVIVFIISLNINYVSLGGFSLDITLIGITGLRIMESLVFIGISTLSSLIAAFMYSIGKTRRILYLARNVTIIGTISGLFSLILFLLGLHSGGEVMEGELRSLGFSQPEIDAIFELGLINLDLGLAVAFGGLVLMGLAIYMMRSSIPAFFGETKEGAFVKKFPEPLSGNSQKLNLKKLWYCPKDNYKLTNFANREVPNSEFSVSKERLESGLQNAIAIRKITPDMLEYAKTLVEDLFENTTDLSLDLVSTICNQCKTRYISPKITQWSETEQRIL